MRQRWPGGGIVALVASCDAILGLRATVPADALPYTCPPSYAQDPTTGGFYRPGLVKVRFDDAEGACERDESVGSFTGHTHLVVIDSEAERAAVQRLLQGQSGWIGLQHRLPDQSGTCPGGLNGSCFPAGPVDYVACYEWVTNEPNLPSCNPPAAASDCFWDTAANQPDPTQINCLGCVDMDTNGQLAVADCDGADRPFVCECDPYAQAPTSCSTTSTPHCY